MRTRLYCSRITAVAILIVSCFGACRQYRKNSTHQHVDDESIDLGKQLAATYCQSCHLLPDPSELDAKSWEKGVLPMMGPRLGIFSNGFTSYPSARHDRDIGDAFYPPKPLLSPVEWQAILDYYTALAPDTLIANAKDVPIANELSLFRAVPPVYDSDSARICFIGIDTVMYAHTLVLADVNKKNILRVSS
jgi:hypothetical protein